MSFPVFAPVFRGWRLPALAALLLALAALLLLPGADTARAQTPVVSSAVLTDDLIVTVNFTGTLKSSESDITNCAPRNAWTIDYNGDSAWPYWLECRDGAVVLYSRTHNQSPALAKHRTVTVSYDRSVHTLFRLRYADGTDVPSFSGVQVTNEYPLLAGASVNGKVLTLTYDQPLDARSRPAASAFGVHMASTWMTRGGGFGMANPVVGRSISGAAVTLRLEHPVPHNAYVSLRYNPPASNPLRNAAGGKAKAITGSHLDTLPVTVLTPDTGEPPALHSAGVKQHRFSRDGALVRETWIWMVFDESLDEGSAPAASAFTVSAASPGRAARAIAVEGDPVVDGDEVRIRLGEDIPAGDAVTVSYDKPTANPLRDPEGNETESFSGETANNGAAPRIESLALVSDPGSDRTYARGDKVRVQVNFSEPVVVSGTPLLRVILGRTGFRTGAWKWVPYESGSGTKALTFAYTVQAGDSTAAEEGNADAGLAVNNTLNLNGGRIGTPWSLPSRDADLTDFRWLPYDANHKVDGSLKEQTFFQSAAVDGTALTVTFDETLDTASVPAPGDFHVTVEGVRRNVASGGVAISGKTVTLTLASAVSPGDMVRVRYTRPSSFPLRAASGLLVATFGDQVATFADQEVSTLVPLDWSATLTVRDIPGTSVRGCFTGLVDCPGTLAFSHKGTSYTFLALYTGGGQLGISLSNAIPRDWTLHIGDGNEFAFANATLSNNDATAFWTSGLVWTAGQEVQLCLTNQDSGCAGDASGVTGNSGEQVPSVSVAGVSVVSDAGADRTYGGGDTIEVQVTFNQLVVDVDTSGGTPRIRIDMDPADWGEKWAEYDSGSGTSSLTFVHTVVEPNLSTQGIAVLANTLELNGGTITANGEDAALGHQGLAHDANHKVDWQAESDTGSGPVGLGTAHAPTVTAVAVTSDPGDDDTYGKDDVIRISVTFDEAVEATGTPRLKIDMDPAEWGEKHAGYASGSGSTTLVFTHTVVEPNYSTQGIAVLANTLELNGGVIRSMASHADAELGHTGLGHDANHKVDWRPRAPAVTAVSITSDPGSDDTYGADDVIRISVTFDEAVNVTGAPRIAIDMDPAEWGTKQAAYHSGSGTTTLVFTHTVVEPNLSTQGIAVLANTLALNGGTIASTTDSVAADLSHTGLAHDADHKVNWEQEGSGGPGT